MRRAAWIANALMVQVAVTLSSGAKANEMASYEIVGDEVLSPLGGLAGNADRGRRVVSDPQLGNCLICHSIASVKAPSQGVLGPRLDGVGRRLSAGQIRLRLIDQRRINPATLMPSYYRVAGLRDVAPAYRGKPVLTAQQIEDVVAFLMTLKE